MTDPGLDPQRCGQRLHGFVHNERSLTIVAPFITISGIEPLLAALPMECEIEVFTRWRPDEVASGVSDPRIWDRVRDREGVVLLHSVLHAKAYLTKSRALVGSANVTSNGLGWLHPGAVEILVDVPANDPAVRALLTALRASSALATEADRDAVLAAAALLPTPQLSPRILTDRVDWLPSYRPPDVLWRVYAGQREESVAELVRPDLAALGVPSGITAEETFNRYVGAILRQGFTGCVARECSNLTTMRAVERLIGLCAATGRVLADPADQWETLAAWIAHFLPRYQRTWGGTRLIG